MVVEVLLHVVVWCLQVTSSVTSAAAERAICQLEWGEVLKNVMTLAAPAWPTTCASSYMTHHTSSSVTTITVWLRSSLTDWRTDRLPVSTLAVPSQLLIKQSTLWQISQSTHYWLFLYKDLLTQLTAAQPGRREGGMGRSSCQLFICQPHTTRPGLWHLAFTVVSQQHQIHRRFNNSFTQLSVTVRVKLMKIYRGWPKTDVFLF